MLCHRLHYPKPAEEKEVLRRSARLGIKRQEGGAVARTEFDAVEGGPVASVEDLIRAMEAVHEVHVSETFTDYVVELVDRTRRHPLVELGASPRAGIALIKSSRARALIHGRHYVIPEDLFALAEDTLLHRMRLSYEALAEGQTGPAVLRSLLEDFGAAGVNGSTSAKSAATNGHAVH
jgi:MoxR-like ATPase